jgi:hypothetical protein
MGGRRADEGQVEDAGQIEVVDEGRPAEQDVGVLEDPADGVAENGSGTGHDRRAYGSPGRP